MSKKTSSIGVFGLIDIVSSIYAFVTTPEMTGLKGAFAAAMTGSGTSFIAALYALGGAAAGGAAGALLCAMMDGKMEKGATTGLVIGALAGTLYGIPQGYDLTKDIIVNGVAPKAEAVMVVPGAKTRNHEQKELPAPQASQQHRFPDLYSRRLG